MTDCPFCLEEVKVGAKRCPHCQSDLAAGQEKPKDTVLVLDRGLVSFGKFALVLFGLFAFVLYTTLGFHIQDSVKEMDSKSKVINDLHDRIRNIGITITKESYENQKEVGKLKEEFIKIGTDFKVYVAARTAEIEGLRSDVEKTRADSSRMLAEVADILRGARLASDDIAKVRSQITITLAGGPGAPATTTAPDIDIAINPARPKLWPAGIRLKVWFLDGDEDIKREVMAVAGEWSKHAHISFALAPNQADSDLRVTFAGEGTWSYVGVDARVIPKDRPTITLSRLGLTDRATRRSNILHEFGHVLGFLHEHQSPRANIQWNIAAMRSALKFSDREIEFSFTKPYALEAMACVRNFDSKSIMMFVIPKAFTGDGKEYSAPSDLSESDRQCAAKMYPRG